MSDRVPREFFAHEFVWKDGQITFTQVTDKHPDKFLVREVMRSADRGLDYTNYCCPACGKSFAEHHEDRDKWRGIAEKLAEAIVTVKNNGAKASDEKWDILNEALSEYEKECGK